ncbi:MAG TPA: Hpt domain-containing protein [Prolixibacteraceae bacterium]
MAYTNLRYLKTITEENSAIVREMIEMFTVQVPDFIKNMKMHYDSKQFIALGKEAHKSKSSLQIMGMNELEKEMKDFQLKTIEGTDIESYPKYIALFETQCLAAVEELKVELASM